jgi:hypothetical protein
MKKIIIIGDTKPYLIEKLGEKHECFILASDSATDEQINHLMNNNHIVNNPVIIETIEIKQPTKKSYSRQSKKWLPNYKYHK